MTITIILASIFSLAAIGYTIWPLLDQRAKPLAVADDDPLTGLITRKDSVLRSIKELEFDYHMGKLSETDYKRFDARLRQQAFGLLRQIERHSPDITALDEALEKLIAQQRTTTTNGTTPTKSTTRFCPECGEPVAENHKFCAACGAQLEAKAAA